MNQMIVPNVKMVAANYTLIEGYRQICSSPHFLFF